MKTIKGCSESFLEIKKSRFLGLCCKTQSEEESAELLIRRKKQYYDASHNCYAYLLEDGTMRFSDDGEPQGTAGLPMLEVLKNSGLRNVIMISTRYFGGTLLGAGGLVRAYSKSAAMCIESAKIVEVIECSTYECDFTYNTWAKAEKLLLDGGFMIDDVQFSDKVRVSIGAMPGSDEELKNLVSNITFGAAILVVQGKKRIERPVFVDIPSV